MKTVRDLKLPREIKIGTKGVKVGRRKYPGSNLTFSGACGVRSCFLTF